MKKNIIIALSILISLPLLAKANSYQTHKLVAEEAKSNLKEEFKNPNGTAKTMIRYWIPEAAVEERELRKDIQEFAALGYGGVEVVSMTTVSAGMPNSINERITSPGLVGEYRWGTEKWDKAMEVIIDEAQKHGLTIDVTNGPAWPVAMPTITNVDEKGSSYEMTYAAREYGAGTVLNGDIPSKATSRKEGTSKIISAYAYKIVSEKTLDYDSKIDLSSYITINQENQAKSTINWTVPSDAKYEVMIFFEQPTAQKTNDYYVVDHFSKEGANKCVEYWENVFQTKPYMKYVSSIFMDSLEYIADKEWTRDFDKTFKELKGYDIKSYLPVIGNYQGDKFFQTGEGSGFSFSDSDLTFRIKNDYNDVVSYCYNEYFLKTMQQMAEKYGMNIRSQVAYNKPMNTVSSALSVGIPETETLNRGSLDQQRLMAASVHMSNQKIYSYESNAEMMSGSSQAQTYEDIIFCQKRAWACGVNRQVMHGASYSGIWDEGKLYYYIAVFGGGNATELSYPGWNAMAQMTSNDWNHVTSVETSRNYIEYMTRNNYIMQKEAKVDVGIYYETFLDKYMLNGGDGEDIYPDNGVLNSYGYSYEFLSPEILSLETAKVTNGRLNENGPGYKAIIIHNQEYISLNGVNKLKTLAEAGLPLLFVGQKPSKSFYQGEDISSQIDALLKINNVYSVEDYSNVPNALIQNSIKADSIYKETCDVLSAHHYDGNGEYYYLYNYNKMHQKDVRASTVSPSSGEGTNYPNFNKELLSEKDLVVSLKGNGKPYYLNTWNGDITPILNYEKEDGFVKINLNFAKDEAKIIALLDDNCLKDNNISYSDYSFTGNGNLAIKNDKVVLKADKNQEYTIVNNKGQEIKENVQGLQESFNVEKWSLSMKTIGQGDTIYFRDSKWTEYDPITLRNLKSWGQIQSIWAKLGGVGTYTAKFNLDNGKEDNYGAYINLGEVNDGYQIIVNGRQLPFQDQLNTTIDIGDYVIKGENTVTIIVSSPIQNYNDAKDQQEYGLLGNNGVVSITPYKNIKISDLTVLEPKNNQNNNIVVPIVIGSSVGAILVAGLVVFLIVKKKRH